MDRDPKLGRDPILIGSPGLALDLLGPGPKARAPPPGAKKSWVGGSGYRSPAWGSSPWASALAPCSERWGLAFGVCPPRTVLGLGQAQASVPPPGVM